jgi:acyl carrier protein
MASDSGDRLRYVFREALALGPDVKVEDLTYNSIKAWDSVAHLALVAALEVEFDIMLETDDVLDMSSFSKSREILEKHGIEFPS